MKNYKEMAESVIERGNEIIIKRSAKRKKIKMIAVVSTVAVLAVLTVFGAWKLFLERPERNTTEKEELPASLIGESEKTLENVFPPAADTDHGVSRPNEPPESADAGTDADTEIPKIGETRREDGTQSAPDEQRAPGGPGEANAVYRLVDISEYGEAKRQFGHDVPECSANGFSGYGLGTVSAHGNLNGGEKVIFYGFVYSFVDGRITVYDESRISGKACFDFCTSEEYNGVTFYTDEYGNVFYPLSGDLLLTANFAGREASDIYDIMLDIASKTRP